MPYTPSEFAARIKAKYPDYAGMDDDELVQKIVTKYPDYRNQISFDAPAPRRAAPVAATGLPGSAVDYLREPNQGKVAGESKRMGVWDALKSGAVDVAGGAMRGAETLGALALDVATAPVRQPRSASEFLSRSTDAAEKWDRWTDSAKESAGVDPALNELYEGNAQINRLGGEILGDPSGAIKVGRLVPKAAFAMDDAVRVAGERAAADVAAGATTPKYSPNPSVERALEHADELEAKGIPEDANTLRRVAREIEESAERPDARRSDINPGKTEAEQLLDGQILDSKKRLEMRRAAPSRPVAAPAQPVAETRKYEFKGTTTDPAAVNAKEWFHGTDADVTGADLAPSMTKPQGLFGMGVYLTDNPRIAQEYATARGGQKGRIYRAKVNVERVIDMEQPAPSEARAAIRDALAWGLDSNRTILEQFDVVAAQPGATTEQMWEFMRQAFTNHSIQTGASFENFMDPIGSIAVTLKRAGWDALTHAGGRRVGKEKHSVLVLLDPNDEYKAGRAGQVGRFDPYAPPPAQAVEAPVATVADEAVAAPKLDPVAHKQVRQFVKKNGITDRDAKNQLFATGLSDEQKATLIAKKLPPVKEVGLSRFYTTTPDKMRDDLGESGMKAWRALDERNFLHETRQVRDERVVRAVTKKWSEQDHIDAFDYRQRTRYGLDPAREATIRPEVKKAVDDVLGPMLDRQAKEISEAGIKVPVDSPEGGREWMQFVPIEEGYAPWYRMGDIEAPGLEPKLAARYRLPDASRTRVMARDEAIAPEELDRHFGSVLLRYFDETNELIATAKAFGNQPAKAIDGLANEAFAEGKDGFYIREALDLALNGGPTLPQMERRIIKNLAQLTVNLTLPFSGPAQLGQLGPVATKAGLLNTLRGIGTALKSIKDGEVRDALVRSAATFESAARGLHEGRTAKGFLGKTAAATLRHPLGVTPLDKLSRYLSAAIGKNYAEDLAKVVRGESVGWYNDLKLSPEVAARELGQMGINPKELAQRELTPDDYDRIIWHFTGDTNLRQRPEYMSLPWQRGPWGKLMGILTRFGMQQWPQFKREVWRPLMQQHRVGPALRWAAATPALGYANKKFGDAVYNRDTDDETPLGVAAEIYAAGIFGMVYQMALATKYGAEGVFSGAALGKVADVANIVGPYGFSVVEGAGKAIEEGDPAYLTEAVRKPLDDAREGKGPLVRAAKIHPLSNAAVRHAQDPDRSLILNPPNPFAKE